MSERCQKSHPDLKANWCHDHEEFHHARSMKEIQAALRKGLDVYDPDGDKVHKARIMPKQDTKSPDSVGRFYLTSYDSFGYQYHVNQVLIQDEPLDEEAAEAEVMKSLMASLARR
jgi:hypothetical protein